MSRSTLAQRHPSLIRAGRPELLGQVSRILGLGIDVTGLQPRNQAQGAGTAVPVGALLEIGAARVPAEVVAAEGTTLRCMPLAPLDGVALGDEVRRRPGPVRVPVGEGLIGRVLDGLGRPLDGKGPLGPHLMVASDQAPPNPLDRRRITEHLQLGIRSVDALASVGRGQRMGLFAGSGVGKSSLLSMVARGTDAAVNVIVLVGERGREVREFLEDDLGAEGLSRSVVVVATSDEPAQMRLRAAATGTRIAEHFRAGGLDVLLMMDSLTRVAMAQREIGLSAGEPPATRGYPPSTFSLLARLLERAGTDAVGSITGIYTVLVDGDDHNEPVADAARSILDGHVVLDRALATAGHYPPVEVLQSISRVASRVITAEQAAAATSLRRVLAARRAAQDLLDVGAYQRGVDPAVDAAVEHQGAIEAFLRQGVTDHATLAQTWSELFTLVNRWAVRP
ncbi:FliI/YscN family ATPase [Nesterenkonia sandarakina]|uniref:Flagellum-specific ATP synthase n=1 Tax=Nesterenkonia sandarakina TaxID=272918 RepID=A0A7Z0J331_9MICC|nr:FliI/YscN family ATPase [Nesterenkonia sandarakina]NYJ16895.1 flagellum-specific ATP synthase [Nesterenkonia sandarakina]